ncbi:uncharacterized protein CMU_014120 [Cryptosporidium muris RN66]|uniref:Uncharacterized protein n=1 Tax=Cryptosporidium muris (strain RN66) TaxID=441375 RepID=B6AEX0_CRYMR|nr:uncharacterized protein CMU_014120 [Cryptosporidium muris RN66]EEA06737.1 hypothetical protein CMU_014120 [Cryptosporidium muris RN66]|eukprot:XP_002141086.1 hypothetical protein [Cryptosporidium muris RN66]
MYPTSPNVSYIPDPKNIFSSNCSLPIKETGGLSYASSAYPNLSNGSSVSNIYDRSGIISNTVTPSPRMALDYPELYTSVSDVNGNFQLNINNECVSSNIYQYNSPAKISTIYPAYKYESDTSYRPQTTLTEPTPIRNINRSGSNLRRSAMVETLVQQQYLNGTQLDNILTPSIRNDPNKLIDLIYKKQAELGNLRVQLDELRKKEIELEKTTELNIARRNEIKSNFITLENTFFQYRSRKSHEMSILIQQLQNSYRDRQQLSESLAKLCDDISVTQRDLQFFDSHDNGHETNISEIIGHHSVKDLQNELDLVQKERNELLNLINSSGTQLENSTCSNQDSILDPDDNNLVMIINHLKQVNMSLFEQNQILSLKSKGNFIEFRRNMLEIQSYVSKLERCIDNNEAQRIPYYVQDINSIIQKFISCQ